jgi:hypothetical protein
MAIHAKANGLLVSVRLLEDTGTYWCIHAVDEKRPKYIKKDDPKNKVFVGLEALDEALAWQEESRKSA